MARTVRTTQPYDFNELSSSMFEDLVRQLAGTSGVEWNRAPEPVGLLGADGGRDIRGWEKVPARGRRKAGEREWRYQAKRYRRLGPKQVRAVVKEGLPDPGDIPHAFVLATACNLSNKAIDAFHDEAEAFGVEHHEVWPRATLSDKLLLNENARIAAFYFGDGPAIEGTEPIPRALDQSAGRDLVLHGRDNEVRRLREASGDVIIVGRPGTGKTRLAMEADAVRFVRRSADADAIAASLRQTEPQRLVLDDAGFAVERLELLLDLRREGYDFALILTAWPKHLEDLQKHLPTATVIELNLLERSVVDSLVQQLGVTNPYLRNEILGQAEGRIGWAVTLTALAKADRGVDVLTGQAIVGEVEDYLEKMVASSTHAMGLLSVVAALGTVDPRGDLRAVGTLLGMGVLDISSVLKEAAAAGVLDQRGDQLCVAPARFREALVARSFFEESTFPLSISDVLAAWPDHRDAIVTTMLQAASDGSTGAREQLEHILPSVAALPPGTIERYVVLDERAAERAIEESLRLPDVRLHRFTILSTAVKRFGHPAAVRGLLELAIGDERPEHSHPDHPIRILGGAGSRIDPVGRTSFELRSRILVAANGWFDAGDATERGLVWARVVAHVLSPEVEGNYTDPGSPMTLRLQGGFEAPHRLRAIVDDFWPEVAARLDRLETEALVALIQLVDAWGRVARRFQGSSGAVPHEDAAVIAQDALDRMLPAVLRAAEGRPAAQSALAATTRLISVPVRQSIDPEFRLLTLEPWRMRTRGAHGHLNRLVDRLADCWADEEPAVLMRRVQAHHEEAQRRQRDLHPMLPTVLTALSERVDDVDPFVVAGLDAGLSWYLRPLLGVALGQNRTLPPWFEGALTGDARATVIEVALLSDHEAARTRALVELGSTDLWIVEQVLIIRGQSGHDDASRALLTHPIADVRGVAAMAFGLGPEDRWSTLPEGWYDDWAEAFLSAPLQSLRGTDNHRLSTIVPYLAEHDPDLVERWLLALLETSATVPLYRLPDDAQRGLAGLPAAHKQRIVRASDGHFAQPELLGWCLDGNLDWLAVLLDDQAIEPDDVLTALSRDDDELADRIDRLLRVAPLLVLRGVPAESIARAVRYGTWMGEESGHFESIRAAFETASPSDDASAQSVREAGMALYERKRDDAARDEHERRVRGEL